MGIPGDVCVCVGMDRLQDADRSKQTWLVVSKIFYFYPDLGKIFTIWLIFFKGVGSTTN